MKSGIISILALLIVSSQALAIPLIDQNQPSNTTNMAGFGQIDLAQSFKQANDNIVGAGIFLKENVGSSDTVTISLWDALPNQAGTMLASSSALGTSGSWLDVFFGV